MECLLLLLQLAEIHGKSKVVKVSNKHVRSLVEGVSPSSTDDTLRQKKETLWHMTFQVDQEDSKGIMLSFLPTWCLNYVKHQRRKLSGTLIKHLLTAD